MDGQRYDIRAQVLTMGGYLARVDQNGLVGFVTRMRHWPSEVRIVHGEGAVKRVLADALNSRYEQASCPVSLLIAGSG